MWRRPQSLVGCVENAGYRADGTVNTKEDMLFCVTRTFARGIVGMEGGGIHQPPTLCVMVGNQSTVSWRASL